MMIARTIKNVFPERDPPASIWWSAPELIVCLRTSRCFSLSVVSTGRALELAIEFIEFNNQWTAVLTSDLRPLVILVGEVAFQQRVHQAI